MLTRAIKQTQNPQNWLPIGQRVIVPAGMYQPVTYASGEPVRLAVAVIDEHLSGGGVALKFDGYANTVDYSANEAMQFNRVN